MSPARSLCALAAVATGAVAVALAGCGGGPAASSGPSPACLPHSLVSTAKLAGAPVFVSPAPGSVTANPRTQVSFMGAPASDIRVISMVGTRSGRHAGRLRAFSQGDGASFAADSPFQPGESVAVRAAIGTGAAAKPVAFSFQVDTPYPTAGVPPFPNPSAAPGEYQSFATLPGVQAPVLNVTVPDRDPGAGDVFMTNGPGPGRYAATIYTPQGRLVWVRQLPGGLNAENLSVQSYEGRPALTYWQGKVLSFGYGQGEDVVLDSHYAPLAKVAGGNGLPADLHDFQLLPGAVAYTTAYNAIRCNLTAAGGLRDGSIVDTAVQQIDTRTGLVRWEWHSLDHIAVEESETSPAKSRTPWDWFHLNSVDPLPGGDVLISARSTWAAYDLEKGSGRIRWRLGGNKSSFAMGPGTKTAWQHDVRMLPGGEVTVFDNGSNPRVHSQSRALRISLDTARRKAVLRSVYVHPAPLLSVSQGNVQTLAGGNTVVGYGAVPYVSEFSPAGQLLFDAHMPLRFDSYRAFRFPWHAQPLSAPAVAASLNSTGEETIVSASWNGATEVASWRVLAGDAPPSLAVRASVPASGFESEAVLPEKYAYAQVQALDAHGRVLASSQAARVGSYAASLPAAGTGG